MSASELIPNDGYSQWKRTVQNVNRDFFKADPSCPACKVLKSAGSNLRQEYEKLKKVNESGKLDEAMTKGRLTQLEESNQALQGRFETIKTELDIARYNLNERNDNIGWYKAALIIMSVISLVLFFQLAKRST